MSTTVEELKKLYTKMGGQEDVSGIQTDAEMIDKLEDVAVPAELPAVTSEDNGEVLGVVEGAWAKMDVPAELPAVTGTDNGQVLGVVEGAWAKMNVPQSVIFCTLTKSGTKYNLDKNWSTVVKPALDAGASLVVKYNYEGLGNVFFNLESYSNAGFNAIAFSGMAMSSDNSLLVIRLTHSALVEEADFVLKGITLTAPW